MKRKIRRSPCLRNEFRVVQNFFEELRQVVPE